MVDAQVEVRLLRHPLARLWLRHPHMSTHAMNHGTLARVAAMVPPKPPLIARANPSHTGPRANDKHRQLDLERIPRTLDLERMTNIDS